MEVKGFCFRWGVESFGLILFLYDDDDGDDGLFLYVW